MSSQRVQTTHSYETTICCVCGNTSIGQPLFVEDNFVKFGNVFVSFLKILIELELEVSRMGNFK